jgi:sugar phosphate isomerase/epimerase
MQIVLNSKMFSELSAGSLGEKALELGYDGIDVCIRPGHPVHPGNAPDALPDAVKTWQEQGLVCPMATAPTGMIDPGASDVEGMYAACAEAGVPRLKIGFWKFREGGDYWKVVDSARADLEGFVKYSEKYGVQTCYQIHSGPNIGSNSAGLMHLIKGFDPEHVGAYPDFGHLMLDGEDIDMALAMIREHLSIVGIKDALYAPQPGQSPPYIPTWVNVGTGCVNWQRCLRALRGVGFDGAMTVHTEYSFDESIMRQVGYAETIPPNLDMWAKEDAVYLRRTLQELEAA